MGKRLIIKGANFTTNAIDRISPSVTYYSVTYNLTNATANNSATSIAAGSSYQVTITAQVGYTLQSVEVRHNNKIIQPIIGTNTYNISSVSGNIVVTATATADAKTYSVIYNLTNVNSDNSATSVIEGSTYSFTLTPNSGYIMELVQVTHNGIEVQPTSGYSYTINNVSGNIAVNASATSSIETYSVTYNLTHCSSNKESGVVNQGATYSFTLTPNSGFVFDEVVVTHNGVEVSGSNYSYTITNVSGDIVVNAVATKNLTSSDVTWTDNYYINVLTGVPKSNQTYSYTGFINVDGFTHFKCKNYPEHVAAYFDSNQTFMENIGYVESMGGGYNLDWSEVWVEIPSGVKYLKCNSLDASNIALKTNWGIKLK